MWKVGTPELSHLWDIKLYNMYGAGNDFENSRVSKCKQMHGHLDGLYWQKVFPINFGKDLNNFSEIFRWKFPEIFQLTNVLIKEEL